MSDITAVLIRHLTHKLDDAPYILEVGREAGADAHHAELVPYDALELRALCVHGKQRHLHL